MTYTGKRIMRQVSRSTDVEHLLAIDPDNEAVVVIHMQVECGNLRGIGHSKDAAEKHRGVIVAHVAKHRAAVAIAVTDRRGPAWPIAIVEVRLGPLQVTAGGMVVALVVVPRCTARE